MRHRSTTVSLFVLVVFGGIALTSATAEEGPGEGLSPGNARLLSLQQALSRVFESNPELVASELEIEAAAARVLQAGRRPNPEISVGGENLAAMGGTGLFNYTESTVQLSQRIELGGKRAARIRTGEREKALAGRRLELKKAELMAATSLAFVEPVLYRWFEGKNFAGR
jgi:outer membrane protein TolC